MRTWLAIAVAVPSVAATAPRAPTIKLDTQAAIAAPASAPHFSFSSDQSYDAPARFAHGTVAEQDLAANATLDLGLADMRGRKNRSLRLDEPGQARNPAVSFVFKF